MKQNGAFLLLDMKLWKQITSTEPTVSNKTEKSICF